MNVKTLIVIVAVLFAACSKNSVGVSQSEPALSQNGDIHYTAPAGWEAEKATSNMRVAQYKLAKVEGDNADAEVVLYYFGPGQGGTAQANIDRWLGQMQQPDGMPSKERAKIEKTTINNLAVTTVDVAGRYSGGMASPAASPNPKPVDMSNYRLRAAIIETPKGSYFVKLTGPQNTVAHWDQSYNEFLKSFSFK